MTNAVLSHDGGCLSGREQNPDFVEVSCGKNKRNALMSCQFRCFVYRVILYHGCAVAASPGINLPSYLVIIRCPKVRPKPHN